MAIGATPLPMCHVYQYIDPLSPPSHGAGFLVIGGSLAELPLCTVGLVVRYSFHAVSGMRASLNGSGCRQRDGDTVRSAFGSS